MIKTDSNFYSNDKIKEFFKNKSIIKTFLISIGFILLIFIFSILTNNVFLSPRNLSMLSRQGSVLMIITSGVLILLISKNFDLSAGAAIYLIGVIIAKLMITYSFNMWLAIGIALAAGIIMGAMQGYFVGYLGISAFIVTLAGQLIFKGTGYVLTNANTISPLPDTFNNISESFIPPQISGIIIAVIIIAGIIMLLMDYQKMKQWYGSSSKLIIKIITLILIGLAAIWVFCGYHGIPMAVFIAAIVAAVVHVICTKTVFGRQVFIIGGNEEAANLAGIKVNTRIFQTFILMGVMYAIAGMVLAARLSGSTATAGNLVELDAVAAAVIGGTSMSGGIGSIKGVVAGVLILTSIDNVMSLMNVSSFVQLVIKGIILLSAVVFDVYVNKSRFKFKLIKKSK